MGTKPETPFENQPRLRELYEETPADETFRAVAFVDKGGTGKTTSLAHLSVVLEQELGLDTLLVDLAGKQGDLAKHFGIWQNILDEVDDDDEGEWPWPNIATTFKDEWGKISDLQAQTQGDPLGGMIRETEEGPDLIATSEELDGIEDWLRTIEDRSERWSKLDSFLTEYVDHLYDVVLIDAAGSTSDIVMNALYASGNVIALSKPSPFDEQQAEKLRDDLETILEKQKITVDLSMVILNELDETTIAGKKFLDRFESQFGPNLAPKQIPSSQDVVNAQMKGTTMFELEDPLITAERAMESYRVDARELIRRLMDDDWEDREPITEIEEDV